MAGMHRAFAAPSDGTPSFGAGTGSEKSEELANSSRKGAAPQRAVASPILSSNEQPQPSGEGVTQTGEALPSTPQVMTMESSLPDVSTAGSFEAIFIEDVPQNNGQQGGAVPGQQGAEVKVPPMPAIRDRPANPTSDSQGTSQQADQHCEGTRLGEVPTDDNAAGAGDVESNDVEDENKKNEARKDAGRSRSPSISGNARQRGASQSKRCSLCGSVDPTHVYDGASCRRRRGGRSC